MAKKNEYASQDSHNVPAGAEPAKIARRPHIPVELAKYPVQDLHAEIERRSEVASLVCALTTHLRALRKCAHDSGLRRDITDSCIDWLETQQENMAEDMYMNCGIRADITAGPKVSTL